MRDVYTVLATMVAHDRTSMSNDTQVQAENKKQCCARHLLVQAQWRLRRSQAVPTAGVVSPRRGGGVTTAALPGRTLLLSCGFYRV